MNRFPLLLLLTASTAWAAPEDRGLRGFMLGVGSGMASGTAIDETGREAGGFVGHGTVIRVGEEAIPGVTLGLEALFGAGEANTDKYASSLAGLLVQLTYRPFESAENLVVILGTGIGGGELTSKGPDAFTGAVAGGLHEVGFAYEMPITGDGPSGLVAAVSARWLGVPASGETPTTIQTYLLGLELIWYGGRD